MKRLSVAIAVLLLLAACSRPEPVDTTATNSPSPTPEPSPSPTVPVALEGPVNFLSSVDLTGQGSSVSVDMTVSESGFDPTFVKVSPLAQVTVNLTNSGEQDRTFTIDSLGVDMSLPVGPLDTFSIAAVPSVSTTFQLPGDGVVNFYDKNGRGDGLQGAFFFQEGDVAGPAESSDDDSEGTGSASTSSGGSGSGSSGSSARRSGGSSPSGTGGGTTQSASGPDPGGATGGHPLDAQIMCAVDPTTCPPEEDEQESSGPVSGAGETTGLQPGTDEESEPGEGGASAEEGSPGGDGGGGESGEGGGDGEPGEEGDPGEKTVSCEGNSCPEDFGSE